MADADLERLLYDPDLDDTDLDDTDASLDDVVFEPSGWDLAVGIGIGIDPDADPPALDELALAMLVWAKGQELERLTDEAVERVWDAELAGLVRDGIVRHSADDEWEAAAVAALAEFDRDPPASGVAREVVRYLAMQVGHLGLPFGFCLCCVEEALRRAGPPDRRGHALRVAVVGARAADVPRDELREALAGAALRDPADRLGTVERRRAVRACLGRLGELATESMRPLALALKAIAAEPLPADAADDDVWQEAAAHLLREVARPELN
jgi:hypothetical protein